jgi:hypothetical protein
MHVLVPADDTAKRRQIPTIVSVAFSSVASCPCVTTTTPIINLHEAKTKNEERKAGTELFRFCSAFHGSSFALCLLRSFVTVPPKPGAIGRDVSRPASPFVSARYGWSVAAVQPIATVDRLAFRFGAARHTQEAGAAGA